MIFEGLLIASTVLLVMRGWRPRKEERKAPRITRIIGASGVANLGIRTNLSSVDSALFDALLALPWAGNEEGCAMFPFFVTCSHSFFQKMLEWILNYQIDGTVEKGP